MNSSIVVILIAVLVVLATVVLIARAKSANDGVDSFRRQIDALSPEARRPVVDQVKGVAERQTSDDDDSGADPDDEDDVRGA